VPAGLAGAAVRAALRCAAGEKATSAAGPAVAALADAVSRALALTRARTALVLLTLALAAAGTGLLAALPPVPSATPAPAAPPAKDGPRTDRAGDPLPPGALARLGTVRFRHGYRIYSLAVSPDGRRLASRGLDGVVRVWDAATARELASFRLPSDGYWTDTVAFSPDGRHLAAAEEQPGSGTSAVVVRDAATGKEVRRIDVRDGRVSAVAFSPDGRSLAGITGNTLRVWDPATGAERRRLPGHGGDIEQLAFAPDGKLLASAGRDRTVRLWDPATGAEVRRLDGPLALAPDYNLDLGGGRKLTGKQRGVVALAFSRDGTRLAVAASADPTFRAWDVATGRELPRFAGDGCQVTALAFAPDGQTILSAGWDGLLRVWDVAGRKEVRHFAVQDGPVLSLALFPDGRTLAVGGKRTVRLWDWPRGQELHPLGAHHQGVRRVAFAPDGKTVATAAGARAGAVCLWDAATGAEGHRLAAPVGPGDVDLLAFAPDGRTLAVGTGWKATVFFWDPATGRQRASREVDSAGRYLPCPEPGVLAGTDSHGALVFWDAATGRELRRFKASRGWSGGALAPDGTFACDGPDHDGTLVLWDTHTGQERRRLQGHPRTLAAIAFSPDGKYLAAAFNTDHPSILVWEVATGAKVGECHGDQRSFTPLEFSPDGKALASGERDGTVRLWEVVTCQERRRFRGHLGNVLALAYSPDGTRLVSGGDDTLALVWDAYGLSDPRPASDAELPALWESLGRWDARAGHEALGRLAGAGDRAVAFLADRLRPAPRASADRLAHLVADLDSESFAVRRQAARELEDLGEVAEPALRRARTNGTSAEARRQVEVLLEKLPLTGSAARLRAFRAVEVLEVIDTPAARRLLERLAGGAPEARLTREAHAALDRLARRPAAPNPGR
jgi:WD40 repeat protein